MASNDFEIKILIANIDKNSAIEKTKITEEIRKEIISGFLRNTLNPKPDFILFQQVFDTKWRAKKSSQNKTIISQSKYCMDALDGLYLEMKELEIYNDNPTKKVERCAVTETSYNSILHKPVHPGQTKKDIWPQDKVLSVKLELDFKLDTSRFCVGNFNVHGRSLLIVSFHGNHKMSDKIKFQNLQNYLNFFQCLKHLTQCEYLIVGGDFNLDMDKYEEQNGENILKDLGLKMIKYQHQRKNARNKPSAKVDALICDKMLLHQTTEVTVFHDAKKEKTLTDSNGNVTKVVPSHVEKRVLDHDPVLFKLWIPKKNVASSENSDINEVESVET